MSLASFQAGIGVCRLDNYSPRSHRAFSLDVCIFRCYLYLLLSMEMTLHMLSEALCTRAVEEILANNQPVFHSCEMTTALNTVRSIGNRHEQ